MASCPSEIEEFSEVSIFSKEKMMLLKKETVNVTVIGDVKLDSDERQLLCLPPKFAVRRRLKSIDMKTDLEMGLAKVRLQINKEKMVRVETEGEKWSTEMNKKRPRLLDKEEIKDLEETDKVDAESRQTYDPITKHFDHGNKRATDCPENKKVTLPKNVDNFSEGALELIKNSVTKLFHEYRAKNCTEIGDQETNLTAQEQKGLRKLQKRVRNKELVVLKR